jgi:parvulin-like peptidyl-prolyl isomerase
MLTVSTQTVLVSLTILFGLATGAPLLGHPEAESESGSEKPLVTIGEEQLTRAQVDDMLRLLPPRQRLLFSKPTGKQAFADYIVRSKLYSREARKRGWDVRPEVQQAIRRFQAKLEKKQVRGLPIKDDEDRKQVLELFKESLFTQVAEKELKGEMPVSAREIEDYYQEHAAGFDMVRGRRLVIRSEASNNFFGDNRPPDQTLSDEQAKAKAEKLRREVQEGADFEVMAAKHSEDPLTSGVGGDTGIVRRGLSNKTLVTPPEVDLLFSLEAGDLSPIVRTPMGFALLKLEEKRRMSLAEAQPEIEARIRNQKLEAWYQQMRLQHRIIVGPSFFKTSTDPAVPAKAAE